ncbi:hypothetical protein P4B35_02360 [Pontiellaceae bacterium B12227]|nr:hypothetical protein [Pontiellaceae bacterium B12227]
MDDFQHIGYCFAEMHAITTPSGSCPVCTESSSLSDWRKTRMQQEFLINRIHALETRRDEVNDPAVRAQAELELEIIKKEWRAIARAQLLPQ